MRSTRLTGGYLNFGVDRRVTFVILDYLKVVPIFLQVLFNFFLRLYLMRYLFQDRLHHGHMVQ